MLVPSPVKYCACSPRHDLSQCNVVCFSSIRLAAHVVVSPVLRTSRFASYNDGNQHTKIWLKGDLQDCDSVVSDSFKGMRIHQ